MEQKWPLDRDSCEKVEKTVFLFTDYVQHLAGDPGLGMYYVKENIRSTVPKLVNVKREMEENVGKIENSVHDMNYCKTAVSAIESCGPTFVRIGDLLEETVDIAQKILDKNRKFRRTQSSINSRKPIPKEVLQIGDDNKDVEVTESSPDNNKQSEESNDFSFTFKKF